jgi:hypothetical protein
MIVMDMMMMIVIIIVLMVIIPVVITITLIKVSAWRSMIKRWINNEIKNIDNYIPMEMVLEIN